MHQSLHQRRQVENEVVFRQTNEKVIKDIDEIKTAAGADGFTELVHDSSMPIHFLCECSDENCAGRIVLAQDKYKNLHKNKSRFIILPGHNKPAIERIIEETKSYLVVEKFMTPPQDVKELKKTDNNTSK